MYFYDNYILFQTSCILIYTKSVNIVHNGQRSKSVNIVRNGKKSKSEEFNDISDDDLFVKL